LARMHAAGLIAAVKEFSGDVRRIYEIQELAPDLEVLAGSDDVVLELAVAGAKGWIAGYPNALPAASVQLWELSVAKDLDKALPMYQDLHALLRWDSKPAFVQAIKLSMDVAGRKGGACRPPRRPLPADVAATVTKDTEKALGHGYR
jgi:dihydrodipicolinate synthase/N-acetylneuraminate lyase